MLEIALDGVQKYYGANQVLGEVTFGVNQGEKVGLLGKNGAGKTTIFKILSGTEDIDSGRKMIRKGAVVGLLDQIADFPDCYTTHDVLYSAFEAAREVHDQMQRIEVRMEQNPTDELLKRYGELQELYEAKDGYVIQSNIDRICMGLKIDEELVDKKFSLLSGGEKTRVMLGKLLLEDPDVLLLDEPTNHLDLSSIEWLEGFLAAHKGTSIIISHDRYFLDETVGRIVEIVDGRAELYAGNYSYFVQEKRARYESQLAKYEQQQKEIKRLEDAAKRMHDWAQRADNEAMHKRAFNIEKRIERMEKTERPLREQQMHTGFSENELASKELIDVRGLCKTYGERTILDSLDFIVQRNEKVAIVGGNGSGKSTLLKLVIGEESPDKGVIQVGESVKLAYLPQVVTFAEPKLNILDTVMQTLGLPEGLARNLLAKYKFSKEDVFKTVENLSGGEKSRLKLCLIMQDDVNLLILDEPTNHLDIDSREWLEGALQDFGGALVFVSHDRYFINKFGKRISELVDGRIKEYRGNYGYYKERKALERQNVVVPGEKREPKGKKVACKTSIMGRSQRKLEELEATIRDLEDQIEAMNRSLADLGDDYEAIHTLYEDKLKLEGKLEKLYEEWMG